MTLVIIFGPPAVGKMTVGLELGRLTGFRLFHNHMTAEPVMRLFPLDSLPFRRLVTEFRQRIFEEAGRPMAICFEVRINAEQPTVAGHADINVLSAIFTFVAAHRELSLRAGGLIRRSEYESEHLEWLQRDLSPGDAVTIRIVESDAPAEPAERRREDPSFLAKQERAYYEHLRRKYERDSA